MAKKSSKSTRRARTNVKRQAANRKQLNLDAPAVIAEGSNEPVAKIEKPAATKKSAATKEPASPKKIEEPLEAAAESDPGKVDRESDDEIPHPTPKRMLVSAFLLGVILIVLVFGAAVIHRQSANQSDMVKSGQDSGRADQILQSGGNVCTNGSSPADVTGSANPTSVGMMLQSNPVNSVQTPQTIGNGADVTTLQGATCF